MLWYDEFRKGCDLMKIKMIEPLVVSDQLVYELAKSFEDKGHEFVYYNSIAANDQELTDRAKDADILIIGNNPLSNDVIKSCHNLKYISVGFTGIDHLGHQAIINKNVKVSNSAGYSDIAVSELVLGLTLNVYRNITKCDSTVRQGGTIKGLIGNEINGKTVGIIGTGRIGFNTAKLFMAFNANVVAYDPYPREEVKSAGVTYLELDELLKQSDIVSLHVPLMESTKHLINKDSFEMMKETAILINCARGPIVDNVALSRALNQELIMGAGIDVFDMEPPILEDYPLLQAKNTVLTPHVAFASDESMVRRITIAFDNVNKYLDGIDQNIMIIK